MKFEYFIGIDISKKTLDFSVKHQYHPVFHLQVSNSREGIKDFLSSCKEYKVNLKTTLLCMEHTGIYNNILLEFFTKKGYNLWLEQGLHIKQSLGMRRGKNDKIDSERISEYAYRFKDKCKLWQPPREVLNQLKKLTGLRSRLIKAKNILKVANTEQRGFVSHTLSKQSKRLSDPVINTMERQLDAIEKEISSLITEDKRLKELFEIITSVEGVGPVTAWELIVTTNEFKDITEGKKYACYAGVAPFEHSSGTSIQGKNRVSRMANKSVKRLLHMSALSATVMKGELHDYYMRKVAEGKNKMSVLNAIRNKLILRIFTCVRENRKYEKFYTRSLA